VNVSQKVAGNAKTLKKTIFFLTTHNDLPLNDCAGRGEPGLSFSHHNDFSPNASASQTIVLRQLVSAEFGLAAWTLERDLRVSVRLLASQ
jgi:hypothetical protein